MIGMETYNGHVRTPADAIILFEACRIGLLPRVQRRLSEKERQSIKSGSVFVWDEREAGMRRWTDGKSWSASRVSGSFLTYREMEGKRGGNNYDKNAARDSANGAAAEADSDGGGPDGYRYKPDGLMKQSFSITTNSGQHLHLISYFSRSSTAAQNLMQPTNDPQLRHIRPEKGMYPDSTVHEQNNIPAVTRGPMNSPGYAQTQNQPPTYNRPPPYYQSWAPPSPMHTPPPHHYPYSPYYHQQQHPGHPMQPMHYPPPPSGYGSAYDRPPPTGAPPPSQYGQYPPPGPYHHNYPPPPTNHHSSYSGYQAPPLQGPSQSSAPPPTHEQRPAPTPAPPSAVEPDLVARKESPRTDSTAPPQQPSSSSSPKSKPDAQATTGASAPPPPVPSSGQTIPSISAMLNAGADGGPPPRASSRSPGGTLRKPLQDIPSHKLGFEASRDVQALRNLDKTTFKQY